MPLYAFGSNASGQLGIGSVKDSEIPIRCPLSDPLPGQIKSIVAGGNHTLLRLDNGSIYYSGKSYDGSVDDVPSSFQTDSFREAYVSTSGRRVKSCSAWWEGSVFVDSQDLVFTTGSGLKGEQGTGGRMMSHKLHELDDFAPQRAQGRNEILDLDSGVDHTVAVMKDGNVWGWGNGRKGKLGPAASTASTVLKPNRLEIGGGSVARVACGRDFTVLLSHSGKCNVIGTGKWSLQSDAPKEIADWKDVHASWGSAFVLKTDGKIKSWGRNDHGQLAPVGLPAIQQLAVGSEHVLAMTKERKVISWGWGEHGNCGSSTDTNGDIKGTWNEIPVESSEKVLGVGAGCATSFFWTESGDG